MAPQPNSKLTSWSQSQSLIFFLLFCVFILVDIITFLIVWAISPPNSSLVLSSPSLLLPSFPLGEQIPFLLIVQRLQWGYASPHPSPSKVATWPIANHHTPSLGCSDWFSDIYRIQVRVTVLSPKTRSGMQQSQIWKLFTLIHSSISPWRDCPFVPSSKSPELLWFPL